MPDPGPVAEAVPAPFEKPGAADRVSVLAPPEARASAESVTRKPEAPKPNCGQNLDKVVRALVKYTVDHGDKLPEAKSAEELWQLIGKYLEAEGSPPLTCPETGKPYLYNTALGGKDRYAVRHEIAIKDSAPHASGEVWAFMVDGSGTAGKPDSPLFAKGTFR